MAAISTLFKRRTLRLLLTGLTVLLLATGCGSGGGGSANVAPAATAGAAASAVAGQLHVLEVPARLAEAPFDRPKTLSIPAGFGIRLLARLGNPRFMAVAPNGDILVSHPAEGRITLLRPSNSQSGEPQQFTFASGLDKPHDMVFHRIDGVTYLYIAETSRVIRSVYTEGATRLDATSTVVDGLPSASTPELQGAYAHELKNIALSQDHKLYVSIASSCNACIEDTTASPVRGAIYEYDADGGGARLYASGLRNAEGLDFLPGTRQLWVTVNSRDELPFPFDRDFDGDGASDLGKVIQRFVDDNPPDLFTPVRDGGNYGWPFCNPLPNAQMSSLAFAPDDQINRNETLRRCDSFDRSAKGIRAHSSPLGMSLLHASAVPPAYRNGAAVALHGCWNCSRFDSGYKVVYIPIDGSGNAGAETDLVSGFVEDPDSRLAWGRPVDVIADAGGNLLISDDLAGAIYQLYPL